MDKEYLRDSLDSIDPFIKHKLEDRITHPYKECRNFGRRLWGLVTFYRSRAILRFLLKNDIEGFFRDLNREALTYVTFLQAYHNGLDIPESRIDGSTYSPFVCALATSNFRLCKEIDKLMPKKVSRYDGEELFAFTTLLRKSALSKKDSVNAFQSFRKTCTGIDRYDHLIKVFKGLLNNDAKEFNTGILEYLESFEELSPEEAEEMGPGEEYLSVEGLAFIQLAKKNDIKITVKHKMIPNVLQQARNILPKDGFPSWPG